MSRSNDLSSLSHTFYVYTLCHTTMSIQAIKQIVNQSFIEFSLQRWLIILIVLFQVDKIYYITKCQLKPANKQYSTLKNEYEMSMTNETVIQECLDDDGSSIPQTKYSFVSIDKIAQAEVNSVVGK